MTKNDGGPAYPVPSTPDPSSGNPHPAVTEGAGYSGMTIRDYFAGQALTGILASYADINNICGATECAIEAYNRADAMLREREK